MCWAGAGGARVVEGSSPAEKGVFLTCHAGRRATAQSPAASPGPFPLRTCHHAQLRGWLHRHIIALAAPCFGRLGRRRRACRCACLGTAERLHARRHLRASRHIG